MSARLEQLDTAQQAADMAAIRARWPRRHFMSLDDCGGDDTVRVEYVSGNQPGLQYVATFKADPEVHRGYGSGSREAVADLYAMREGYAELQVERAMERGTSLDPYDAPRGGRL